MKISIFVSSLFLESLAVLRTGVKSIRLVLSVVGHVCSSGRLQTHCVKVTLDTTLLIHRDTCPDDELGLYAGC